MKDNNVNNRNAKAQGELAYDNYQGADTCPWKEGDVRRSAWFEGWYGRLYRDEKRAKAS